MRTTDAIDYFIRAKKREGLSPTTVTGYRRTLDRFAAVAPPVTDDIDKRAIEAYVDSLLEQKISRASVARYCREVKVFCRWLKDEGDIEIDPWAKVRIPKVPQEIHDNLPSRSDIERLVAACNQKTLAGRRDAAIVLFLYETGVRVSEMAGLRRDDVDLSLGRAKVTGKGSKDRYVFFGSRTVMALQRYRMRLERFHDPSWFFVSQDGVAMNESSVRQMLLRLKDRSGVRCDVNPHAFRHAFATQFLRNGGDLHSLQRLLGHASLAIVQRYLSLATEDLAAKHREYSPLA